ncbi:hypothetical protein FRC19_011228 [Serendipita sp. 401]|nr:hypothetical protein FRC15_002864 [Serendipita sp. 397]KAG8817648.1 hypothetical protein FRC19_011228 [Serendipita sp. 401]KAG8857374.1 hypothetical protein FRC20_000296 [Serendipita sp. 405]KAG9052152.1 hypothetical protein FS842_010407 [Serendipita sp. 407]
MCVGFWTTNHPDYALILLNNRDEFLSRPAESATVHHFGKKHSEEGDEIISGLDTKAGGTWLGISRHGRLAMLTNITEEPIKRNTSRGNLVSSFLLSSTKETMQEHVEALTEVPNTEEERLEHRDYSGFNMLLISLAEEDDPAHSGIKGAILNYPKMTLVTNSGGGGPVTARWLDQEEIDIGGLSNGVDGKTMHLWTKVEQGKSALNQILEEPLESEEQLMEKLFSILAIRSNVPVSTRDDLRHTIRVDPIEIKVGSFEDWYGTRTSSIILIRNDGFVIYRERDIWKLDEKKTPVLGDCRNDREHVFWLYQ